MMKPIDVYSDLANKWREYSCKASCILLEPYNPDELIAFILDKSIKKNNAIKVMIIVDDYTTRCKIVHALNDNNITNNNYTCISYQYIKSSINYKYDLAFYVGITNYSYINYMNCRVKYGLFIITTDKITSENRIEIYKYFPIINQADYNAKNFNRFSYPVEEKLIGVDFINIADKEKYNEYTAYINTTINIFGSFDNINRAKLGDKTTGQSAEDVRLCIAQYNGWNENLNTTIPFNKQIDDLFNPISLEERASTAYNIIRERNNLVNNNCSKIPVIINLLNNELKDKKVVVISKNGELATTVCDALTENNISCGEFHNDIEPRAIYDNDANDWIRYKSGLKKGEVKMFGSQAISSLSIERFNSNNIRVLSIKNCSSESLEIACDVLIFMSPNCFNIKEFLYRYNNITFNKNKINVYKLYMKETNEEIDTEHIKPMSNKHVIKNINKDDNFLYRSIAD